MVPQKIKEWMRKLYGYRVKVIIPDIAPVSPWPETRTMIVPTLIDGLVFHDTIAVDDPPPF